MLVMSPTSVTDEKFVIATKKVVNNTAASRLYFSKRVRLMTTIMMIVSSPTIKGTGSISRQLLIVSITLRTLLPFSLEKPVRSPTWPKTVSMPNPLRKPVITALEMKRTRKPSLSRPMTSIKNPTNRPNTTR